jgi:hypothetical protein
MQLKGSWPISVVLITHIQSLTAVWGARELSAGPGTNHPDQPLAVLLNCMGRKSLDTPPNKASQNLLSAAAQDGSLVQAGGLLSLKVSLVTAIRGLCRWC